MTDFFRDSTAKYRKDQQSIRETATDYLRQRMVRATAATLPDRILLRVRDEKTLLLDERYRHHDTVELFVAAKKILMDADVPVSGLLEGMGRSQAIAILLSNAHLNPVIKNRQTRRNAFTF